MLKVRQHQLPGRAVLHLDAGAGLTFDQLGVHEPAGAQMHPHLLLALSKEGGPDIADPHGLVNQGQGNATAKAIQIYEGEELDRDALVALLRAIVANNRAGGWRRLAERPG